MGMTWAIFVGFAAIVQSWKQVLLKPAVWGTCMAI